MMASSTGPLEYACAILIDLSGRYLFQKRDDIPGILHPGKTGLFGGHREGGETFLQCIVREVHEEISYFLPPERFTRLLGYRGAVAGAAAGDFYGEFFIARDVPPDALIVTEGQLRIVEAHEVDTIWNELSSTAQFVLGAFRTRQASC